MTNLIGISKRFFNLKLLIFVVCIIILLVLNDFFSLFYNKKQASENEVYPISSQTDTKLSDKNLDLPSNNTNLLVIADSHLNSYAFPKIKDIASKYSVKLIIHLGDHTNYGSKEELENALNLLQSTNIEFVALPGDRDLAAANGDSLFYSFFERVINLQLANVKLLFIDNSPNFTLLSDDYLTKVISEIPSSNIVFLSQPIYVNKGNIFENKFMGSLNAFSLEDKESMESQKLYLNQRNKLLNELRANGNKLVIAGDHHRSSLFKDPENDSITYFITGASSEYLNSNGINIKQKSFQSERITIISIDKDLKTTIHEIELFEK